MTAQRPSGVEEGFDAVQGVVSAQGSAECVLYLDNGHKPESTVSAPCVQSPLSGGAVDAACRGSRVTEWTSAWLRTE